MSSNKINMVATTTTETITITTITIKMDKEKAKFTTIFIRQKCAQWLLLQPASKETNAISPILR